MAPGRFRHWLAPGRAFVTTPATPNPSYAMPPQVNSLDAAFLEQLYTSWKKDPNSVSADWRTFFQGFELGYERAPETDGASQPVTTAAPAPQPRTETAAPASKCHPNYSGCVPVASDVDCAGGTGNGPAYVQGPVRVLGADVYGLDADDDGVGCE